MNENLYKIGATSRATGISVECLRAWERRYGLQPAARRGQMRLYDAAQLNRLKKLKALVDRGKSIGQLAHLNATELDRQLGASPRIGVVGGELLAAKADAGTRLDIHGEWASPNDFESQARAEALPDLDIVAVLIHSLHPKAIEHYLDLLPDLALVVAYRLATEADLRTSEELGVALLRWPAPWAALEDACLSHPAAGTLDPTPRRFNDDELLHLATAAPPEDQGCVRGLVEIVYALNAYVVHATRCEGGSRDLPASAAMAAKARAELEASLDGFVERFGLIHRPEEHQGH